MNIEIKGIIALLVITIFMSTSICTVMAIEPNNLEQGEQPNTQEEITDPVNVDVTKNQEEIIEPSEADNKTSTSTSTKDRNSTDTEKYVPISEVFLNGQTGNDSNDGLSESSPVKTFAKAREILMAYSKCHTIYVTGRVDISKGEEQEWSLSSEDKVVRHPNYIKGKLVSVAKTGSLTLKDIIIDGNSDSGIDDTESIINVSGTLNLESGSVLQNNDVTNRNVWARVWGGAIYADENSKITIDGGTIKGCSAVIGGAICTSGEVILNDGTIENNSAVTKKIGSSSYTSCGGAIALIYDGNLKMNGGIIRNNSAEYGGGIACGPLQEAFLQKYSTRQSYTNVTITEGTIERNKANRAGGGIFVQMNGTTIITGGKVIANELTGPNAGVFGGGGIYVNGGKGEKYDNGLLKLTNVLIRDNVSKIYAAGIASCPTSSTNMYLGSGGAVYNNIVRGDADVPADVYSTSIQHGSYWGNPTVTISDAMLGGGDHRWKYTKDGSDVYDNSLINYSLSANTELKIYSSPSDADKRKAEEVAKVIIRDNSSLTAGGGVGSNGNVVIGESGYGSLKIHKTVSGDGADVNRSFVFNISLDDKSISGKYGDIMFETGEGEFCLKHGEDVCIYMLPEGIKYSIEEENVNGYEQVINGNISGTIESDILERIYYENKYNAPPNGDDQKKSAVNPEKSKSNGETGDHAKIGLYLLLLLLSTVVMIITLIKTIKESQ